MSRPKVFVSYKRQHPKSTQLLQELKQKFEQDFELLIDQEMSLSTRWSHELYDRLLNCDAAIVLVSKEANQSDWCRREWAVLTARWNTANLPVLPICVEDAMFNTQILDEIQSTKGILGQAGYLKKVHAVLSDIEVTPRTSKDFLAAHHAWLQWQYQDAPVFQREPYSLADVYIEPECGQLTWGDIQKNKLDPFTDNKENGGRQPLLSSVSELISKPSFEELIALQAGPGAGKSSFTLRLASHLIYEGFQPILLKFKELRLNSFANVEELLDDAIRIGPIDEDSPHPDMPIIKEQLDQYIELDGKRVSKCVIILDGWDEVSLSGNASFKAQLSQWLPKIREYLTERRGPKVRLILTGRPSNEVCDSGVLRNNTPILTLRLMPPKQLQSYADDIAEQLQKANQALTDNNEKNQERYWSLCTDSLAPVFSHYQAWFEDQDVTSSGSTGDFLGNPLLAYLAFRVFAESDKNAEQLISNPTALYRELIDITVKNAGKGQCEQLNQAAHRGGAELRRLLQEVAVTISMLRGESVSFDELEMRFDEEELPIPADLLKNWHQQADATSALQELVINFYFKGGNTHLGCEFLHKSFREYLYAEAIFYSLLDESKQQQGLFTTHSQYEYWQDFTDRTPEYRLSRRLAYLLSAQWLSNEVRDHLFWLVKNHIAEQPNRWQWLRGALVCVYAWWAEGVLQRHQPSRSRTRSAWQAPFIDDLFLQVNPLDRPKDLPPIRTCVLDAHLGLALMQLTALVFEQLMDKVPAEHQLKEREIAYIDNENDELRFKPFGDGFIKPIVARLEAEGWRDDPFDNAYLNGITINGNYTIIRCLNFFGCQLREARLIDINFDSVNFDRANLNNSLMDEVRIAYSSMDAVSLNGASCKNTNFSNSIIAASSFYNADLEGSNLEQTNLRFTNLENANLTDANLTDADLKAANLTDANLTDADLTGANLKGANLDNVIGYNLKQS